MRLATAILASLALALASACSVIVQPPDDRVRCAVNGGVDPCPAGQRCLDGVCTTLPDGGTECMPQETGCNDRDDDCDGTVDEGSDMDGDGFDWCDPEPGLRDCRDDDPSIHPGRPGGPAAPVDVPCDGADNDCSGAATECPAGQVCHPEGSCRAPDCSFAIVCPAMQRCNTDLVPPSCEAVAVDCTVSGCASAPGSVCDPVSRMCIPPRMVGETCSFDAQCGADLRCFETAALGLRASDVGGAAQVCSRACCTSGDCPTGSTCWASGSGARGCVPTSILAAGPSGAPADEACGRTNQCGGGTCAARTSPAYDDAARRAFTCGSPVGFSTTDCDYSSDCASGLCVPYCDDLGFFCVYRCASACGGTADCSAEEYCGYVRAGSDAVQACVLRDGFGDGGQGDSCSGSRDCRGLACLPGAGRSYCADTCCTDADCGSPSFECRPRRFDGFWAMLCQER